MQSKHSLYTSTLSVQLGCVGHSHDGLAWLFCSTFPEANQQQISGQSCVLFVRNNVSTTNKHASHHHYKIDSHGPCHLRSKVYLTSALEWQATRFAKGAASGSPKQYATGEQPSGLSKTWAIQAIHNSPYHIIVSYYNFNVWFYDVCLTLPGAIGWNTWSRLFSRILSSLFTIFWDSRRATNVGILLLAADGWVDIENINIMQPTST